MWQSTLFKDLLLLAGLAAPALVQAQRQAPRYGQCGGGGAETAICPSGYKCQYVNAYYSQCVPEYYSDPPTTTTKSPAPIAPAPTVTPTSDPVVGATSRKCYPRRKIETLQSSYPAQFNMFILALESLMATPEDLDLSWWGIAGIHGAPYEAWQMDPNVGPAGPYNTWLGYCTHGSPIFSTWHRPYVLLLEQSLQRRALEIAEQFTGPSHDTYAAAAEQLRLPYWDWSDPVTQSDLPHVTKPGTGGVPVQTTINNPLFQYNFKNSADVAASFTNETNVKLGIWMWTTRSPLPDGTAQNSISSASMADGFTSRRAATYDAFSFSDINGFNEFSTSIENIHNSVHVAVGGTNPVGHMSTVEAAAFDPIFWLHHCNVDRLIAMYQAIYPSNVLQPAPGIATFARIVPGIDGPQDDLNTGLYPFKHPNGKFWNSDDIKSASSIWKFNYGYEEVPCEYSNKSAADLSSFTLGRVNALYGPAISDGSFTPVVSTNKATTGPAFVRDDFLIRTVIDHSELPGSWTLHVFFGKPKVEPIKYAVASNRVGYVSSFGNHFNRKPSMIYQNDVPLSDVLYERKVDYKADAIVSYLTQNLYYAITSDDDKFVEIPITSLKTFRLAVYTRKGTYPNPAENDTLPVYSDPTYLPKITRGKPGGITSEREILYPGLLNGTRTRGA
ncbi:hypothetical protein BDZ91DRAFT_760403 [Kalaharituber pfeilii]|nr:hypothetical protein BDZ91DRAFT_760403 [Kalaharituber pfeilii]